MVKTKLWYEFDGYMERIRAQGKTSLAPADVVIFTCDSTDIYIYLK